jgi:hypothetical protein
MCSNGLQRLCLLLALLWGASGFSQSPSLASPDADASSANSVVFVDVSNVLGRSLPARVELRQPGQTEVIKRVEVPQGTGEFAMPAGKYDAYVHVYEYGVPILIDIKPITVQPGDTAYVLATLLEGASGNVPLRRFDSDWDLALDRVELTTGTDPADAASIPGEPSFHWSDAVLNKEAGWYRGDLHSFSSHSIGKESVAELVKRADSAGLDFLAITDRNTLAHTADAGFSSKKVVLIPAMEWGADGLGYALLLAPRTFPRVTAYPQEAQAQMVRVQMQKGAFIIAHPCFSSAPWQWPVLFPNAIEVWCREWRKVPPITVDELRPEVKVREEGAEVGASLLEQHQADALRSATGPRWRYPHPLARAAASAGQSANGQALLYAGFLLNAGMKACLVGGSHSASPDVPLGRPLTYVYAKEQSVAGIVEGIRYGRTYVTAGPEAPRLHFSADIGADGTIDAAIGDTLPLGRPVRFMVNLWNAKGKRVEVLRDGQSTRSAIVNVDPFAWGFEETMEVPCFYQVRVVQQPDVEGFGFLDVLALSSPIYVEGVPTSSTVNPEDAWISIESAGPDEEDPWQVPDGAETPDAAPEVP